MGDTTFYGEGMTVDTSSKFTVVTQFLTGSDGSLSEIKRFYVQNGQVIPNSQSTIPGVTGNSITTDFCNAQKTAFGDTNDFASKGGMAAMGEALDAGMVLVMSLWDDHYADMLWLDSTYPTDSTSLGAARGTCATTSGVPADVEAQAPNSNVIYSNIKFGPINSTFSGSTTTGSSGGNGGGSSTSSAPSGGSTGGSSSVADHYGQCGGIGWTGPTTCQSPYKCTVANQYYSQCL